MMTNYTNTVLYTGVTSNLARRVYEHQQGFVAGFTKTFFVKKLVYTEVTDNPTSAIMREKQIKHWNRARKNALVESMNPEWKDISDQIR